MKEKKAKKAKKYYYDDCRSRTHWIRSYHTQSQLDELLQRNLSIIYRYAYAYHTEDLDDNGKKKEPHFHLWIKFRNKRSINQTLEMLSAVDEKGKKINANVQLCDNDVGSIQYLIHQNAKDKYQYDESIIVAYNVDIAKYLDVQIIKEDNSAQIFIELLDSYKNSFKFRRCLMSLVSRFGKEFIYNIRNFECLLKLYSNADDLCVSRLSEYVDDNGEIDESLLN